MNNHLIIFIAYKHIEIVKSSLDRIIKYDNADVFVVENKSENSNEFKNYKFKYIPPSELCPRFTKQIINRLNNENDELNRFEGV